MVKSGTCAERPFTSTMLARASPAAVIAVIDAGIFSIDWLRFAAVTRTVSSVRFDPFLAGAVEPLATADCAWPVPAHPAVAMTSASAVDCLY